MKFPIFIWRYFTQIWESHKKIIIELRTFHHFSSVLKKEFSKNKQNRQSRTSTTTFIKHREKGRKIILRLKIEKEKVQMQIFFYNNKEELF